MAEARDQLQKLTECCICFKSFTDPRMLPCLHTFCLDCLKQTAEAAKKKPVEKFPCPLCRKEFVIPADGIGGLQKNFFMQHLMDVTTMLQPDNKPVAACVICEALHEGDEKQTKEATMRCLECGDNFCDMCSKMHKLHKSSRSHNILKIGNETEEDIRKMQPTRNCPIHNQQLLNFYCSDCKKIICVSCFVENHASHKCKDVTTVEKEFRHQIEMKAVKISECVEEMLLKEREADEKSAEVLLNVTKAEDKIQQRSLELKEMIDSHTMSLLDKLSLIKQKQIKDIANDKEEIERSHTLLKSFQIYCTELKSKGSASDICGCVDELVTRANELEKDHEEFLGRPIEKTEVSFQATNLEELLKTSCGNIVGQVQVRTETTTQLENFAVAICTEPPYDVVKVNLQRPNDFSTQTTIPTNTLKGIPVVAVYCNKMYITGIGNNTDEIWKYDITSGWVKCASLVQRRNYHCAAFIDEVLYICGGYDDKAQRNISDIFSVETYNVISDKCTIVGKLVHSAYVSGNCVPVKSSLYIFGGYMPANKAFYAHDHVQVYNTKENSCSVLSTPMPRPRYSIPAVLWEKSVILLAADTCYIFNIETEAWEERKQFATGGGNFGLVLENERIFVVGFRRGQVRCLPIRDILDDKSNKWEIHATFPNSCWETAVLMRFPA